MGYAFNHRALLRTREPIHSMATATRSSDKEQKEPTNGVEMAIEASEIANALISRIARNPLPLPFREKSPRPRDSPDMSDSCRWLPTSFEPKSSKGPLRRLSKLDVLHSFYLSAATDRFPLSFQGVKILKIQGLFNL
ncbi:hypothetical protein LIER_39240 [Lithospermum erythrorhizon]|uniref:Uncharacterized protein n=1 Tax=Lithospermum erythrorhizon TaxID=34254 RepID=A0AAV3QE96_LITER